ncbi:MAG: sigma-E processing peptidase SpoIIGA [bacterium]|nr:sigma-E processing peptidase SpoIIGA [bacterium]
MAGVLYIDIWFGVNFCMNLLLLWILGEVGRKRFQIVRLLLAAAGGAFGACLLFFVPVSVWLQPVLRYAAFPCFMILCAFPVSCVQEGIRMFLLFYLAAFLTGGIGEILVRHFGRHIWSLNFLIISLICVIKAVLLPLMKGEAQKQKLYDIELEKNGERADVRALLDTGNRLYEPYGGKPVCVVSASCVQKLAKETGGILYIPYQSIGKQGGILPAVVFDRIRILGKQTIQVENPVIALYQGEVSADGSYQMLLHGDLLKEKEARRTKSEEKGRKRKKKMEEEKNDDKSVNSKQISV